VLLLEIVAVVLLADFVSGLVHWWEDAYARVGDGPLGRVARDNLRHHARPREFLANGYWASSWDLWLLGAAAVAACAWLGALSWHVLLFAVLVANANQIHKWAHMQAKELPTLVAWLQRAQLLQTTRHHSRHHQGQRNTHYCVITNFLNPVLEEAQLWTRTERAIERLTGIRRRDDERELAAMGLATRRGACNDANDRARNDTRRPDFAVRLLRAVPSGVRWQSAPAVR
jgi:ubiquitin-conjugating enzyme E2 variant